MHTDLQPILDRHPGLLHRARFVSMRFDLCSSGQRLCIEVEGPRIQARPAPEPTGAFTLEAEEAAWAEFARPQPRPGFHDIIALVEAGHARFSGDGLAFFRNLFLVKGIVSAVFRGEARW